MATAQQQPFHVLKDEANPSQKWKSIFRRRFLKPEDYLDATYGEIEAQIKARWTDFVDRELPSLVPPIQVVARSLAGPVPGSEAPGPTTPLSANELIGDQ